VSENDLVLEATDIPDTGPVIRPLIQLTEQTPTDGCCGGGSCAI
jgi:hypothetical protein